MLELYKIGIDLDLIKEMIENNNDLINISKEEVNDHINILESINCNNNEVINIISCNPNFLFRLKDDVIILINYLKELGFTSINVLFDSNPYILNLDKFEIEDYISERLRKEKIEDIIDDLESKPYLFLEM